MSAKGTPRGDTDGRIAAAARPVRKTRTTRAFGNFYVPPTRQVRSVGRYADRHYDPETGRRRGR